MRKSRFHVGFYLGNRLLCDAVRLKGRAAMTFAVSLPVPLILRPGMPALMGADQRKRQLIGQQLIECQALPCRRMPAQVALILRVMRRLQRFMPTGPALPAQVVRVEPFRQIGCAGHGFANGLAQDLRRQAGRHADRSLRPSEWNRPGPARTM